MNQDIISTKRFFTSHHINLSDYWLESCIQWYREEHPNSNCDLETLHLKVYEQWLLLDLRDVDVPVLPANLAQQKKVVLNGIYPLQLLQIVDISRPKLWQIQKIRNSTALSNASTGPDNQTDHSARRMLQLLLTDGVNEVEAIEYKPIKVLHVNINPGIKIKITGPVTVRNGQMMLEEKHVSVLGGEVEELLVANAAENILARSLNLPLNSNPRIIEENTEITLPISYETNVETSVTASSVNLPSSSYGIKVDNQNKLNHIERKESNFISEEEEMHIMEEVDMLLEAEKDIMEELKPIKTEYYSRFEDPSTNTNAALKIENDIKEEPSTSRNIKKTVSTESLFEDIDIDAELDLIDEQIESSVKGVATINNLLRNRPNITSGKFTIKAKFKKVVEKLTVREDAWSLKLVVTDDTGDLEAYMHTNIISNTMGYCPSAMMALKKGIANKDQCATNTVLTIIEELKQKIMKLDCLMDVMFKPDEDCPTIINLK